MLLVHSHSPSLLASLPSSRLSLTVCVCACVCVYVYGVQSAAEDDGALGVDDEFDVYEDLELDAITEAAASAAAARAGISALTSASSSSSSSSSSAAVGDGDAVAAEPALASPSLSTADLSPSDAADNGLKYLIVREFVC